MLYEGFLGKYVADAFDGKTLWLLLGEEELRGRYQYGTQPPHVDRYSSSNRSREHHTDKIVAMQQILTIIFGLLKITRISGI
jgi:hypothetical protein